MTYRCWCEQCDWEDTAPDGESAAKLVNLGHGVATGHHETFVEEIDD